MIKRIILILCLFLLVGCTTSENIDDLSYKEIIDQGIVSKKSKANINSTGFRYNLPSSFSLIKDDGFNHELFSRGDTYYLRVDEISYYYKSNITTEHNLDDYEYYEFDNGDKSGYVRIVKNNDTFYIELCYNYAIIEVKVKEGNIKYAISRGIDILKSIEYNDVVIEKIVIGNNSEGKETVYKIPEPEKKNIKNILEYMDDDEEEEKYNGTEENTAEETEVED